MTAEIITIGDEILIGQVVDTNSAWLASQLTQLGIRVSRISTIHDDAADIKSAIDRAFQHTDLILTTGGLGPTKDDITKETLCDYFGTELVQNEQVLVDVKRHFDVRGIKMPAVNTWQAMVPASCKVLRNHHGTAPGIWMEKDGKVLVSMPGVPYEMQGLTEDHLLKLLPEFFQLPAIAHQTVITHGIGESALAELLEEWENELTAAGLKLAYLPQPGLVRLRILARGEDSTAARAAVDVRVETLKKLIPQYLMAFDDITLEQAIGDLLAANKLTLSTAESCTGGYVAHLITSISGSSAYFKGSIVSYTNEIKMVALGVAADDLNNYGAVSEPVVEQMAKGVRQRFETDFAIATSGIAGPSGGTPQKPVGTVWIAVAGPQRVVAQKFTFGDHRGRNIRKAALQALSMLRTEILR